MLTRDELAAVLRAIDERAVRITVLIEKASDMGLRQRIRDQRLAPLESARAKLVAPSPTGGEPQGEG